MLSGPRPAWGGVAVWPGGGDHTPGSLGPSCEVAAPSHVLAPRAHAHIKGPPPPSSCRRHPGPARSAAVPRPPGAQAVPSRQAGAMPARARQPPRLRQRPWHGLVSHRSVASCSERERDVRQGSSCCWFRSASGPPRPWVPGDGGSQAADARRTCTHAPTPPVTASWALLARAGARVAVCGEGLLSAVARQARLSRRPS